MIVDDERFKGSSDIDKNNNNLLLNAHLTVGMMSIQDINSTLVIFFIEPHKYGAAHK